MYQVDPFSHLGGKGAKAERLLQWTLSQSPELQNCLCRGSAEDACLYGKAQEPLWLLSHQGPRKDASGLPGCTREEPSALEDRKQLV